MSDSSGLGPGIPNSPARRCIACYYVLECLTSTRCPECGRAFDFGDSATYTIKPPFVRWKLWLPGFLLSILVGALVTGVLLTTFRTIGWAVVFAAPTSMGALLGYRCRVGPIWKFLLGISAVIGVVSMLFALNISGLLCGVLAVLMLGLPVLLGVILGALVRRELKRRGFEQAAYLPVIGAIVLPLGIGALESRRIPHLEVEVVETSRVFEMSAQSAWLLSTFYESLHHPRPLLLNLGLAPLRTVLRAGPIEGPVPGPYAEGQVYRCVYEGGRYVDKRITRVEVDRRIEFEVLEQHIHEERSIRLRRGSFTFGPEGPARTRVTLSTEYEALLRPRFGWRPLERWVSQTLHDYVLDGIERARAPEHPVIASVSRGGR